MEERERDRFITKRHNLRDNLEDLVTFPLPASTFGEARGHLDNHDPVKLYEIAGSVKLTNFRKFGIGKKNSSIHFRRHHV